MPVRVECQVARSVLRWWLLALFVGIFIFLIIQLSSHWWAWLAPVLVIAYVIWQQQTRLSFDRIRIQSDVIVYWLGEAHQQLEWQGEVLVNHFFVRFTGTDEDGLIHHLEIWRDSVSHSSWRALNMVAHVLGKKSNESTKLN